MSHTIAVVNLFSFLYGLIALGISQAEVNQALAVGGLALLGLGLIFCLLILVRWRQGQENDNSA